MPDELELLPHGARPMRRRATDGPGDEWKSEQRTFQGQISDAVSAIGQRAAGNSERLARVETLLDGVVTALGQQSKHVEQLVSLQNKFLGALKVGTIIVAILGGPAAIGSAIWWVAKFVATQPLPH